LILSKVEFEIGKQDRRIAILEKTILEMGGELPNEASNIVLGPEADLTEDNTE